MEKLTLYPFQQTDVNRIKDMPHVLMFHEMGLGKTIMAIKAVSEENLLPCLIICPKSLKLNWWDEIKKWTNQEAFHAETCDEIVEYYFTPQSNRKRYFIIHHEALAYTEGDPIREMIAKISWKSVVLDESHRFRNLHIGRTRTLLEFNNNTTKFMFLTGTPIVNSTFDLYPMLKLIGVIDSPNTFLEKYTRGYQTSWGYKIIGSRNIEHLLEVLAPIYIRRTKGEVLKDLPEKSIQTLRLQMPKDQREVYNHFEEMLCLMLDDGEQITSSNILALLTRLRQLSLDPNILNKSTSSSKTQAIQDLLESNQKEKWVIASTSKKYIKFLQNLLQNGKPPYKVVTITGDESTLERYNAQKRFRDNPMIKVMAVTFFTGGLGLNLQAANNIIIADKWWNWATIQQQIDRVHRIGQTRRVLVYILENENSIDQVLGEAISEKEQMTNEVVVEQEVIQKIYEKRRGYEYH